jgi:hypothetical protein
MELTWSEYLAMSIRLGARAEREHITRYARTLGLGSFAVALEENEHDSEAGINALIWGPTLSERTGAYAFTWPDPEASAWDPTTKRYDIPTGGVAPESTTTPKDNHDGKIPR